MADPFSIISLLGTASSLSKTIVKYASGVKDAPKKLKDLSSELPSLQIVFDRLVKFIESEQARNDFVEVSTLFRATEVRSAFHLFRPESSSKIALGLDGQLKETRDKIGETKRIERPEKVLRSLDMADERARYPKTT